MQTDLAETGVLDELIPIVFAVCVAVIMSLAVWGAYRLRRARIDALKEALTRRTDLDPETLAAIVANKPGPGADIRKGLLWCAAAAATVVFSFALPDGARRFFLGAAAFPLLVGLTFIAFHLSRLREDGA